MTIHVHKTQTAHRLGWMAGRALRRIASLDHKACGWLVAQGLPVGIAKVALWAVKLVVFAALLYAAFWAVLLLLTLVAVATWAQRSTKTSTDANDGEREFRNGWDGYGIYRGAERVDGGSADDE
jgi:hypothetical protein